MVAATDGLRITLQVTPGAVAGSWRGYVRHQDGSELAQLHGPSIGDVEREGTLWALRWLQTRGIKGYVTRHPDSAGPEPPRQANKPAIHLTFHEYEVPRDYARQSFLRGHRGTQMFAATVRDGQLRVIVSSDPAGRGGQHLVHVSASVGKPNKKGAFRAPTDDELEAVRSHFFLGVQSQEVPSEDDPHVRHLWQAERRLGEPTPKR